MGIELKEYKCPNCGGAIKFDSSVQNLKCQFCDTEFAVDIITDYNDIAESASAEDSMSWDESSAATWDEAEDGNVASYICNSCGGEIIADQTTAASECPYCGNPIVMKGKITGDLKPDYVIPFKLDKEMAKQKYYNHLKGKWLLPKVFRDQNHIDEIKGVYVPFWLYDADVDATIAYKGTKTRGWSDSTYTYTETSYYSVERAGSISFAHVPADGSERMDDALMESLEPFDFKEAVDFNSAYLAGYMADRYDVDAKTSESRANERIKNTTKDEFRQTAIGYTSLTVEHASINMQNGKAKYAFYPVWILNTTWQDKKYTFAMNGQTGRFVGDLPVDKGLKVKYFVLSFLISFLVIMMVSVFGLTVSAAEIPKDRQYPLVVDAADLLDDDEETALLEKLEDISKRQECEVALVTTDGTGGKDIEAFADDFYDYNGYGYGSDDSGIMLVIDMDEREWAYTTYGKGIDAFTDERQASMTDYIISDLSGGDYAAAFNKYADVCDEILTNYNSGNYDDPIYLYRDDETGETYEISKKKAHDYSVWDAIQEAFVGSVVVSLIIALITVGILGRGMKSVNRQNAAAAYVKPGSLKLTRKRDVFLYKNVSRVRRQTSSSSGSSHSGGSHHSTVHHSSSGRSHGGSHGHF